MKQQNKLLILGIVLSLCGLVSVQTLLLKRAFHQSEITFDRNVQAALNQVTSELLISNVRGGNIQVLDTSYQNSNVVRIEVRQETNEKSGQIQKKIDQKIVIKSHSNDSIIPNDSIRLALGAKRWADALIDELLNEPNGKTWEERVDTFDFQAVLSENLSSLGVDASFEFALKNQKDSIFKSTTGFSETDKTYSESLFPKGLFTDQGYILLTVNNRRFSILGEILTPIVLSALFLILAAGLFVYIFGLYNKQKEVSEARDDFINSMSHELKTPLATITLSLENMVVDDTKSQEYANIIREENQRMQYYVENILQLAKMDNTEFQVNRQEVNVRELIEDVVGKERVRVESRYGTISFECTDVMVSMDPMHIKNVFHNLIDNAIKYNQNPPTIEINVEKVEGLIRVKLKDNGQGIDASDLNKIFDKFYRVGMGNIYSTKGTGIGLSYCKHIVDLHGGQIGVTSELNQGSTFIIDLPVD